MSPRERSEPTHKRSFMRNHLFIQHFSDDPKCLQKPQSKEI